MPRPRTLALVLTGATVLIGGVGGFVGWQAASARQTFVVRSLPARPDLSGFPEALRSPLAAADRDARSLLHTRGGLATLGRLYHANGFLDEASACYATLARLDPTEPRWPHLHATILAGYGEIEPALALWRRVVELAPGYLPSRLRLGDCELKANRPAAAAAAYQAVLQREPDNPYAQLGLARLDCEALRWDAARPRLEKLVRQTNFTLGYDLIVTLYERTGQPAQAEAIRATAKAFGGFRDPADPWLDALIDDCYDPYRISLAAGVFARANDLDTAARLLDRALALAPRDVSTRFQRGTLALQRQELSLAREQFARCTEIAPDFADGWAQLSALQTQLGEKTAGEQTLTQGLRRCPLSPGLNLMRARQLQAANRPGEAIAYFRESIRLRANEADAYLELAKLLIGLGRETEAIDTLLAADTVEPGNPEVLGILAFHAISTGNQPEAQRWLERIARQPRVPRDRVEKLRTAYRERFNLAAP